MDASKKQTGFPVLAEMRTVQQSGRRWTSRRGEAGVRMQVGGQTRSEARRKGGVFCLLACLCLLALLLPAYVVARGGEEAHGVAARLCCLLGRAGLPPTDRSVFGVGQEDGQHESETDGDTDTDVSAFDETTSCTESSTCPDPGATIDAEAESQADPSTTMHGSEDSATEPASEFDTAASESGATPEPESPPEAVPGVAWRDVSEYERGSDFLWNDTDRAAGTGGEAWRYAGTEPPIVLIVCSHPFESYRGGDAAGTVGDLAVRLADDLRARGIQVIFVSSALSGLTPDTSVRASYARTQALVRHYCRLYTNIALVLDLRRSAETVGEDRLATLGSIDGHFTAQARFIVDALRNGADCYSTSSDAVLAQTLRRSLYAVSPTVSRPVWLRASQGLIPADTCEARYPDGYPVPCLLTLELGASGNTYEQADCLVPYVGEVLAEVLMTVPGMNS